MKKMGLSLGLLAFLILLAPFCLAQENASLELTAPASISIEQNSFDIITATVNNTGDTNLTDIALTASELENVSTTITPDGINLTAGSSDTFSATITVSAEALPGNYTLAFEAASGNVSDAKNMTLEILQAPPPQICTPDAKQCVENDLQQCNPEGTEWGLLETCEYGCDSTSLSCSPKPEEEAPPVDYTWYIVAIIIIIIIVGLYLKIRR